MHLNVIISFELLYSLNTSIWGNSVLILLKIVHWFCLPQSIHSLIYKVEYHTEVWHS
nr:MAG TPA: hypothetical protein [Caudoviricetes sp.]